MVANTKYPIHNIIIYYDDGRSRFEGFGFLCVVPGFWMRTVVVNLHFPVVVEVSVMAVDVSAIVPFLVSELSVGPVSTLFYYNTHIT